MASVLAVNSNDCKKFIVVELAIVSGVSYECILD
jgi:hypothetical protein